MTGRLSKQATKVSIYFFKLHDKWENTKNKVKLANCTKTTVSN